MSFSSFYKRSKNCNLLIFIRLKNQIKNITFGILHHFFSRNVRIRFPYPCIQKAQKIVDFSYSSNSRTRIFICCFLLNRNNWTQSRNLINIGAFHVAQKVPNVGRKCFDVTSLTFGTNSIKCQR